MDYPNHPESSLPLLTKNPYIYDLINLASVKELNGPSHEYKFRWYQAHTLPTELMPRETGVFPRAETVER